MNALETMLEIIENTNVKKYYGSMTVKKRRKKEN